MNRIKSLLAPLLLRKSKRPKFDQRLILHIGAHRTATTSVQRYMKRNSAALIKHGVFLPENVGRHSALFNSVFDGERSVEDMARGLQEAIGQLDVPIEKIILSDEDVSMRRKLGLLAQLREFYPVQVVYTLRRQDIWLESWYFQNVKWQWDSKLRHATWEEFLSQRKRFHWIEYDSHLAKLERLFGADNVTVNVFEKGQMPDGPVVAFCNSIGLTDREDFSDPPYMNASMSAEMVEFFRHLPLGELALKERTILRNALEQIDRDWLGNTAKQSERLMPLSERKAILQEYEEGNSRVAQRYFGRNELFLEPLPAPDVPLAELGLPERSEETMQRFLVPLVRQLASKNLLQEPDRG